MGIACAPLGQTAPMDAGVAAIEVRDLTMRFKGARVDALARLSISVPQGVIYGILGPNGAGKTTLLSILCGLITPQAGSVCVGGLDRLHDPAEVKRLLGVAPQEPAIYPTLTARENLAFYGRMQGLAGARLESRIQACLELAEIADLADTRVEHFSGGFKRRLNLVIALIHEPRILILDEPTVAIDPHSRSLIHQRLRDLHAAGVTILISTHYMDEAEQLCHQVAIMSHGRLVIQGGVQDLLAAQRDDTIQIRLDRDAPDGLGEALGRLPEVGDLHLSGRCLTATAPRADRAILALLQVLRDAEVGVESMGYGGSSLERFFLTLTDEEAAR